MRYFTLVLLILCSSLVHAMEIRYQLHMPKPQNHYFEVEMLISKNNQKTIDLKLPVWAPGSYLVREFSRHLNQVKAYSLQGAVLPITKKTKNAWEIDLKGQTAFVVKYEVYAFELSVRTSFLDETHGFVSGPSMFMYLDGHKETGGELLVQPHSSFKRISTGLTQKSDVKQGNNQTFTFDNYDQLVDCPIEIGNQYEFDFEAAGVKHTVAMYGEGNFDPERLKEDMAKIVEEETKVVGVNPNKRYVFIVHNYASGGGGLEHLNSTVLGHSRGQYASENGYKSFLSLVAHEYFHLWNVKRLRPVALGPFNYDAENYTSNLWIAEGFTAYYDNLFVRRAGFYSPDQYLGMLASGLSTVANQPGSLEQSAHEASFDAWIKQYRPNENSRNSSISYYDKGSIIAMLMDLEILQATSGQKKLDDVMNTMYYQYYYKLARGYTDAEFKDMAGKIAGKSMETFYNDYVYGTKKPDYNAFLKAVGYQLVDDNASKNEPYLGISASARTGKFLITSVARNSPAWRDGLNVNDELLSINDEKVSGTMAELDKAIAAKALGDKLKIGIIRDGLPMTIDLSLDRNPAVRYRFVSVDKPSKEQLLLRAKWLAL